MQLSITLISEAAGASASEASRGQVRSMPLREDSVHGVA
jgi:hypothetical protein